MTHEIVLLSLLTILTLDRHFKIIRAQERSEDEGGAGFS